MLKHRILAVIASKFQQTRSELSVEAGARKRQTRRRTVKCKSRLRSFGPFTLVNISSVMSPLVKLEWSLN